MSVLNFLVASSINNGPPYDTDKRCVMTLYFSAYHIEPKKEDYPFTPFAHVRLQMHGQGKDGAILIGPS